LSFKISLPEYIERKPTWIDIWYDRKSRSWVAQLKDDEDDTAYRVIKELNKVNPDAKIVYIGEGKYGCTADENFFDHFEMIYDDEKFTVVVEEFEQWNGIHDYPRLGKFI